MTRTAALCLAFATLLVGGAMCDGIADAVKGGAETVMNATDAIMPGAMNATMNMTDAAMNATMNMTDAVMNATMPEEMAGDDGRRKLMQLEGLSDAAQGAVDKAKDVGMNVADKAQDVAMTVGTKVNDTLTKVNDTAQAAVDKVNEFIGGASASNATMMNDTMMNDTMMNGTEMANDTIAEMPEEMAGDDGRRKLMDLEGLQDSVQGVVDNAKDIGMNVVDKGKEIAGDVQERVNNTVTNLASTLNETAARVNETVQTGVDRVNEFIGNVSGSGDAENDTMMNGTEMSNDTIAEMPEEMAGDDGRRKLMEMMEEMANATDAIGEMNMTMNATMNATDEANSTTEEDHDHDHDHDDGEKEESGDDGRRKLMEMMDEMANATDAIGEMNMTMNATDAMNMTDDANATMPEEMAGDDDGRRKLMDVLSGVRRLAMLQ